MERKKEEEERRQSGSPGGVEENAEEEDGVPSLIFSSEESDPDAPVTRSKKIERQKKKIEKAATPAAQQHEAKPEPICEQLTLIPKTEWRGLVVRHTISKEVGRVLSVDELSRVEIQTTWGVMKGKDIHFEVLPKDCSEYLQFECANALLEESASESENEQRAAAETVGASPDPMPPVTLENDLLTMRSISIIPPPPINQYLFRKSNKPTRTKFIEIVPNGQQKKPPAPPAAAATPVITTHTPLVLRNNSQSAETHVEAKEKSSRPLPQQLPLPNPAPSTSSRPFPAQLDRPAPKERSRSPPLPAAPSRSSENSFQKGREPPRQSHEQKDWSSHSHKNRDSHRTERRDDRRDWREDHHQPDKKDKKAERVFPSHPSNFSRPEESRRIEHPLAKPNRKEDESLCSRSNPRDTLPIRDVPIALDARLPTFSSDEDDTPERKSLRRKEQREDPQSRDPRARLPGGISQPLATNKPVPEEDADISELLNKFKQNSSAPVSARVAPVAPVAPVPPTLVPSSLPPQRTSAATPHQAMTANSFPSHSFDVASSQPGSNSFSSGPQNFYGQQSYSASAYPADSLPAAPYSDQFLSTEGQYEFAEGPNYFSAQDDAYPVQSVGGDYFPAEPSSGRGGRRRSRFQRNEAVAFPVAPLLEQQPVTQEYFPSPALDTSFSYAEQEQAVTFHSAAPGGQRVYRSKKFAQAFQQQQQPPEREPDRFEQQDELYPAAQTYSEGYSEFAPYSSELGMFESSQHSYYPPAPAPAPADVSQLSSFEYDPYGGEYFSSSSIGPGDSFDPQTAYYTSSQSLPAHPDNFSSAPAAQFSTISNVPSSSYFAGKGKWKEEKKRKNQDSNYAGDVKRLKSVPNRSTPFPHAPSEVARPSSFRQDPSPPPPPFPQPPPAPPADPPTRFDSFYDPSPPFVPAAPLPPLPPRPLPANKHYNQQRRKTPPFPPTSHPLKKGNNRSNDHRREPEKSVHEIDEEMELLGQQITRVHAELTRKKLPEEYEEGEISE